MLGPWATALVSPLESHICSSLCVFNSLLCVSALPGQGEEAGCGISKIISQPDGKTSHIPFEVPHVILCVRAGKCVCGGGVGWEGGERWRGVCVLIQN